MFFSRPCAALAIVLGMGAAPAGAGDTKTAVIVNSDQAGSEPDRQLLRGFFTLRITVWPDGEPVHIFVLPDQHEVHDLFCREQLGTYPYVLRTAWDRRIYTGTGLAPVEVRSEEEMRQRVLSTPGAIGYWRPPSTSFLPAFLLDLAALGTAASDA
jgi:ABC-type phosphate transport system substrate-binding protein